MKSVPISIIPEDTTTVNGYYAIYDNKYPVDYSTNKEIINVYIYPNPFKNSTTIKYDLEIGTIVTMKLIDLCGKEIAELYSGKQIAGKHEYIFNDNELETGFYIVQIKTQNQIENRKLLRLN